MTVESFTRLEIYRDAEGLADEIWRIVSGWESLARQTLGAQLVRAADSVGANIAEGWGRETWRERVRHCHIARGSLMEVRHWLRQAHRRDLLPDEAIERLSAKLDRLGPMLNSYIRFLKSRLQEEGTKGVREELTLYELTSEGADFRTESICGTAVEADSTNQPINESTL